VKQKTLNEEQRKHFELTHRVSENPSSLNSHRILIDFQSISVQKDCLRKNKTILLRQIEQTKIFGTAIRIIRLLV
jgi:hypothetical protein